jgi:hypothetical protein
MSYSPLPCTDSISYLLLVATKSRFGSKTDRHGAVSSAFFILKQLSTLEASGMEPAQSLKASGVHAALCSAIPRFSSANAIVEKDPTATSATKTNLYFDIFDPFFSDLRARPTSNKAAKNEEEGEAVAQTRPRG